MIRRAGLVVGAVAALAVVPGIATATHGGHHTPCGDASSHPAEEDTTVYLTSDGAGVISDAAYAEVGSGGVHGGASDSSLYGHAGPEGVCAGSAPAGVHDEVP